jgi:YidC/Oxa1 family membrane protein insertase
MFDLIIVKPLANILFTIYAFLPGHDFGLAVIILTALLRFALWPVLAKQLQSQKKIQALQPEIAKLKKEANGDKQKENTMLMELYKEREINPLASCLPLLIQLPFLFGLYMLFNKSATGVAGFEHLLYEPVKNFPFIQSVLADHALFIPKLFGMIDLSAKHNIVLALLAGASQFYQVRQITPQVTDKDDPNAAISKMTMWLFPVVTGYIGYTLIAALPLYWTVSNAVSIFQQAIIMGGEVDKMEEAEIVKTTVRKGDTKAITSAKTTKKKKKGK